MDGNGSGTPTTARAASPYVGLSYYTEADAEWFFGRDDECQTIIANLRAARLTILYAQSGVGKSSLLRAGVVRELGELARRRTVQRGSARYVPVMFSAWKDDPVEDLIGAIEQAVAPFALVDSMPTLPEDRLDEAIEAASASVDSKLLIILDQFEEYFLYRNGEAAERKFVDELARCVNRADLRANFLISIREDAYPGLGDLFAGKVANIYSNYLQLEYLERDAARETIVKPIENFNRTHPEEEPIEIEGALVEAVLDQVRTGEVVLGQRGQGTVASGNGASQRREEIETPYLQLVMTTLWARERERGSRILRLDTLHELGGAEDIVRTHLDGALQALPDEGRETALDLFRYLVTPSGTKIVYAASDLAQMIDRPQDEVAALLAKLAEGHTRIVRHVPPPAGKSLPDDRYEIFHDVLAPAIIDWRRRAMEQRRRAEETRERQRLEREKREAQERARRERRRARTFRALAIGCALLAVLAAIALSNAEIQKSRANRDQTIAKATLLDSLAREEFQTRPDAAALLSLEAYRLASTPESRSTVLTALQADEPTFTGHTGPVNGVAFSPNGELIASASNDETLRLWSLATHQQIGLPFIGHTAEVNTVAFSPNGQLLASGSKDDSILFWSVATHKQVGSMISTSDWVNSVNFSPNGQTVAAATDDYDIHLYSVAKRQQIGTPFTGDSNYVNSVAFNEQGTMLASGSSDRTVRLWSVATHRQIGQSLTGDGASVTSVAFSPDGSIVASGSSDGTVRLWSVAMHQQTGAPLPGDGANVNTVAFSPDGTVLASGDAAGAIRLWSVATHQQIGLRLTGSAINQLAWSRSGIVASANGASTVTTWNLRTGVNLAQPLAGQSASTALAASPSANVVATTVGTGRALALWDVSDRRQVGPTITGNTDIVTVAFSPDGKTLAAGSIDHMIRLWNVETGKEIGTPLNGHTAPVESVAFSPDGRTLASGGLDDTVRLWNVGTGRPIGGGPMTGDTRPVESVAFSPDGTTVASGSSGGTVRMWSATTGKPIAAPLRDDAGGVNSVAFSPDGSLLASGNVDGTITIWSPSTDRPVGTPLQAGADVMDLAWSRNGQTLADVVAFGHFLDLQLWEIGSSSAIFGSRQGLAEWAYPAAPSPFTLAAVTFASNGQLVTSDGGSGGLGTLVWSPLMTFGSYGTIRDALCPTIGRSLTPEEWTADLPGERYHQTC